MTTLNLAYLGKVLRNVDYDPCDTSILDQVLMNFV